MQCRLLSALLLLALPLAAAALDEGPSSPQQAQTELWLQLQNRAQVASPIRQPATQAERERAMQRWLNSFQHEIPEYYKQDEGGKLQSSSN
jgi:hypothetical protein